MTLLPLSRSASLWMGGFCCLFILWNGTRASAAEEEQAESSPAASHYEKVLAERGVEPTGPALAEYLRGLHPGEEQRRRAAKLIEQLGTPDSYQLREEATKALLAMPVMPVEQLAEAARSGDPEVRWRAKHVLEVGKPEAERALFAVMKVIAEKKLGETVPEVLRAIPLCDKRHLLTAAEEALAAAATPEHAALLRESLASKDATIRAASATALGAAIKDKAAGDLQKLLKDDSEQVRLAAARAMADYGDRQSLAPLVELLASQEIPVRVQASMALREFTGQHFAFAAYDSQEKREAAVKQWRDWISGEGKTAELHFPLKRRGSGVSYLAGNLLLAYGYNNKVAELDPSGKEVWSFSGLQGAWSAEKLANGNVLAACNTENRVIEIDGAGKIVWEYSTQNALNAKQLDNGNYLIAVHGGGRAIEVTPDKKIVWEQATPGSCSDIHRLENGNTLIGSYGGAIVEYTPDHKEVWRYDLATSYGCQALANGNVLIADFNGRVIEVDREKKIVWEYTETSNPVDCFRTEDGNTLITTSDKFIEVTPDKKVVNTWTGCQYGSARR